MIVAIIFVTTSRERLVRGLSPTNCDSPAVKSRNNHYEDGVTVTIDVNGPGLQQLSAAVQAAEEGEDADL